MTSCSRLVAATLGLVPLSCREREPVPAYNFNLGTAEQPLLPTAQTTYDPEMSKSTKKVELPKRSEPGETPEAPATPPDAAAQETAASATPEISTNGAAAADASSNGKP